jgi:hypothetical protein
MKGKCKKKKKETKKQRNKETNNDEPLYLINCMRLPLRVIAINGKFALNVNTGNRTRNVVSTSKPRKL